MQRTKIFNWNYILVALIFAYTTPVWVYDYFPTLDGSSHVANSAIIKNLVFGSCPNLSKYIEFTHGIVPNWTGFIVLGLLQTFLDPITAEKLLVSLYIILFITSSYFLLKKINPDSVFFIIPLALFSFNTNLFFGNYNFLLGFCFYLLSLNWLITRKTLDNKYFYFSLCLIFLGLYCTHLLGLIFFATSVGTFTIQKFFNKEISFRKFLRCTFYIFLSFLPCLLLFIQYYLLPKLPIEGDMELSVRVAATIYSKFLYSFSIDEVTPIITLSIGLWAAFFFSLYYHIREKTSPQYRWLITQLLIFILVILVSPATFAGGWSVQERLSLTVFTTIVFWLSSFKYHRYLKILLSIFFLAISCSLYFIKTEYIEKYSQSFSYKGGDDYSLPEGTTFISVDLNPFDSFSSFSIDKIPLGNPNNYIPAYSQCSVDLSNFHLGEKNTFPIKYVDKYDTYKNLGEFRSINSIWFIPPKLTLSKYKNNSGELPEYLLLNNKFSNVHKLEPEFENLYQLTTEMLVSDFKMQLDSYYSLQYISANGLTTVYKLK